jgi:quercetin dioxygenase-like cupin family protein
MEATMLRVTRWFTIMTFGISLAVGAATGAIAQDASPAAEGGPPAGLTDEILAVGMATEFPATPAVMLMERITIAPGAEIPGDEADTTLSFFLMESGSLQMTTSEPLTVIRAKALATALQTPGTMPEVEEIAAGAAFTLEEGDSVLIPPGVGGSLRNDGPEPVVLLATQIIPA